MNEVWKRFRKDRIAVIGAVVVVAISLAALFAPLIVPYDPYEQFFDGLTLEGAPLPPDGEFWLGTDLLGRDQLSRLIYGARTSLIIGIAANATAVFIGTLFGATAGYVGGWVGTAIMRFTDLMMAFPALLLAIALSAILKPSLWIVVMVIALVNWVQTSRVMYTQTRALVEQEFIEAARALGAAWPRILLVHILPHLVPHILVWATLGISVTVLLEATLSFLGIGVQPPMPSWGGMIFESQSYFLSAPWLVFFPGISILLVALAFNVVGDGMRDALDPTQRGRE
jgi:peptide/nickel transport system permease protein